MVFNPWEKGNLNVPTKEKEEAIDKDKPEKPSEIRDLEMKKKILAANEIPEAELKQMMKEEVERKINELFGKESKEK